MTKKIDEIELHSKEVQDIMGRMPSWLIRNGIVMVLFLLLLLVVGSWFFRYPDMIAAPVVVSVDMGNPGKLKGNARLTLNAAGKVKIGQQVNLKFVGYPFLEFGVVKGMVGQVSSMPTGNYFAVEVELPGELVSTLGKKLEFKQELKGTAEIITDEESLLSRILSPVRRIFSR